MALLVMGFLIGGFAVTSQAASGFTITAKAVTSGQGKAKISWKDSYHYEDKYFRVWRKETGESDYMTVGIDYENVTKIRVLNVCPDDESGDTSNRMRYFKWLKGLSAVTKSDGTKVNIVKDFKAVGANGAAISGTSQTVHEDGLLSIAACSLSDFNENASKILKKSKGKWNYDVVVFGFNDGNKLNGKAYIKDKNGNQGKAHYVNGVSGALSKTGYNAVKPFIEDGNGVIFGHDVIVNNLYNTDISYGERAAYEVYGGGSSQEMWTGYYNHYNEKGRLIMYDNYFNDLAEYAGVKIVTDSSDHRSHPSLMADDMYVTVEHDGLFNRYPYNLGDVDTQISLNGKVSHVLGTIYDSSLSGARAWLKFSLPCEDEKTPAYFLVTRNNCAVIQTGHSDNTSTDERKILANLTFYCNQLVFGKGTFTDASANDKAAPDKPSASIAQDGASATITCTAADNGTSYSYYVRSYQKNDTEKNKALDKSNTADVTVTTGVSYYKYLIDTDSTKGKAAVLSKGKKSKNGVIKYTVDTTKQNYLHILAVDGAGNVGAVKNVKLPKTIPHTLTVDPNGGTWEGSMEIQKFTKNEIWSKTIKDARPQPQIGKTFTSWAFVTTTGGTSTFNAETKNFIMGNSDAALTAQYTYIKYKLAYDYAGGSGASGGSYPAEVSYEEVFAVTPPVRTGHTFLGWTVSGMSSTDINKNSDYHYYGIASPDNVLCGVGEYHFGAQYVQFKNLQSKANKDGTEKTVTFTASWQRNSYTLTVDPNGGTWEGSTDSQTFSLLYEEGKNITQPERTGYTFTGWSLSGAGSSISGMAFTMGYENAVLTACWTPNHYVVKFNGNGSTEGSMDTLDMYYDERKTLPENKFARTTDDGESGFLGWSVDSGARYPELADKAEILNLTADAEGEVTLYAIWDDCPWVEANDLYYTLEQAQSGYITLDELMSHAEAGDREDGVPYLKGADEDKGTTFDIWDYSPTDFTQFQHEGSVTETYRAIDSYGHQTLKRVTVHLVDTTPTDPEPIRTTRFINEKYYYKSYEEGGLEPDSIWLTDPEYVATIKQAFENSRNNTPLYVYHFSHETILEIKEFIKEHGFGNGKEPDAHNLFNEQFLKPNRTGGSAPWD